MLQQRQAAFPSQKCRGTHERVWWAAGFVLVERRGGELGIGLLQLEVWWEQGAGARGHGLRHPVIWA